MIQCLELLAELALADGAPERAGRLYASASVLGQKHAIPHLPADAATYQRHLAQVRALLGSKHFEALWVAQQTVPIEQVLDEVLAEEGGVQPQPVVPHGLSPREIDVLRLLVDGRSNQEIAEALFISPHTVANHVTNIMNKLGVESRTAAATYAIRHDLV